MSDAERQSPRTAIRKWLQLTDSRSTAKLADPVPEQQDIEQESRHHSGRHHSTRFPAGTEGQHDKEAHQTHRKSETRQRRVSNKVPLVNSLQAQHQEHSKSTALNSNDLGLAEQLGLHAPFRTFKNYSDDEIPEVQSRLRKRRRSRSSTSSYLEPAAVNDFSENGHNRPTHATKIRTATMRPGLDDKDMNNSIKASQISEVMSPSPEKLLKSYERRPRHKTRLDRYEPTENNRHGKQAKQTLKKDRREKKQKKHKLKEKSGAALIHDFTAQNVVHDRLTLKPAKTLGLFGKGRASSPVRRRGLPDLAFSEMTFLTSRREKPKDSFEDSSNKPLDKKKLRKLTKVADTEAEISRYFMSAKPTSLDTSVSHRQQYQEDKRRSRDHKSPQALVDLPEKSFLGFGNCGPNASISPVKSPMSRHSKSLRRGVSRSPTRSTSYLSWSQSRGPSYASPPPDKRDHVEPLKSSKLSNRKRTSPASNRGQHLSPLISPPGVKKTSPGTQEAASRPSSKLGNANKAPDQTSESRLALGERLRSREKIQTRIDTETIELDAAKMPRDIEGSIPDKVHPSEPTKHDSPSLALTTQDRAACQSARHEPRREPPAHDVRSLSAQMPIGSPHKDQLDDILEELLRDCNTNVAGSDPASRAKSSHCSFPVVEEERTPAKIQERVRMPAHAFISRTCALEASASASKSSRKPHSASFQVTPAIDSLRSTHASSRGSLNYSNRPSSGYYQGPPPVPTQNHVDSRNAWNDYDNSYERQQEQASLMPKAFIGHQGPYEAVQNDSLGPSGETDHGAESSEYVPDHHSVDIRDESDDCRPYWYDTLQKGNNENNSQQVRYGEWYDESIDHGASYESGASTPHVFHEGLDNGTMAMDHTNDHQEREQSFSQGADEPEIEERLFTTNMPEIYSSWRPRHISSSNFALETYAADARCQDVNSALSKFWTPHKLY